MADPPTEALLRTLYGLGLCTGSDLARCGPRVRRIAGDLPTFDTVWIDALQQIGRLTPFQAGRLDAGEGESLRVGPCVLVDRLGPARTGRTFVARHRDGREHCVLKILRPGELSAVGALRRLELLVAALSKVRHPSIVGPGRIERDDDVPDGAAVAVSDWVDGPSAEELLVRRGRFPAREVLAVARQLAEGLAALESAGLAHGDLRTSNARLDRTGRVVLVDAGTRSALEADTRLRDGDGPERFDGFAPERIGNGRPPDVASEVYAFGCLLWTLLAGRPPFPTGDVLGKLAAHRERDVPEIAEVAPETPAELVHLVTSATSRDPAARPGSFTSIARHLGRSTGADRAVLARFHASFDRSVPALPRRADEEESRRGLVRAAAAIVLIGGCLAAMSVETVRFAVVDAGRGLASQVTAWLGGPAPTPDVVVDDDEPGAGTDGRLPLPEPDANGVVVLDRAGPYRASELATIGPLVVRGASGVRPVIEVVDEPCRFWGEELTLENVTIRAAGPPTSALVLARCQSLRLSNTVFEDDRAEDVDGPSYLLAWKPLDDRDAEAGAFSVEDVVLAGDRAAFFLAVPPSRLSARNVLKTGRGAFVAFATNPAPGATATVSLANVTLRGASHLVRTVRRRDDAGVMWIEADECVFDLAGTGASLLAWMATDASAPPDRVQVEGRGSVVTPGMPTAIVVDRSGRVVDAGEHSNVIVEGLTANRVRFAGTTDAPAGSTVESFEGPRIGGGRPGFDVERIAVEPGPRRPL